MSEQPTEEETVAPASVDEAVAARSPDGDRIRDIVEREAAEAEAEEEQAEEEPEPEEPEAGPTPLQNWQNLTAELVETGAITIEDLLDGFGYVVRQSMPFQQSPNHVECPDCAGWGSVFTGSKLPGSEAAPCDRCQGAGYISASLVAPAVPQAAPPSPQAPPDTAAGYRDPMTIPPEAGGIGAPGMQWNPQAGRWIYPEAP